MKAGKSQKNALGRLHQGRQGIKFPISYTPLRALDIVPTHYVTGVGHADLDDDGDIELIINQGRYMNGLPYDNAVPTIICDRYLDLLIGGSVKTEDGGEVLSA